VTVALDNAGHAGEDIVGTASDSGANSERGQPRIAVWVDAPGSESSDRSAALAQRLRIPVLTAVTQERDYDFVLQHTARGLELRSVHTPMMGVLLVNINRKSWRITRRDPLAKAVGRRARRVADATAGFGGDTLLFARMGFHVVAIERSPVVAAVLRDALSRAGYPDLQTYERDSCEALWSLHPRPDVVYLDPMYPRKRHSSALPGKELQILRALVGDDDGSQRLFTVAAKIAQQRVVVKRPLHAPPLVADPTLSFAGKLARYDAYLLNHYRRQ
jgi:16S rRNA (guanine1516-N2)-methyltransferase